MKPLKGHPYHNKTEAELHYIIKDAGQAALTARCLDEKAEAKYLDQVNDACTILGWRRKERKRLRSDVAHDEELGHKVDLEQVLAHTKQQPYAKYSDKNLIQVLEEGRNFDDYLREEIIKRLARLANLCDE